MLDPDEFYILASREKMQIPADLAAEMAPIDPAIGEFRVHYAGFFDPGFGQGADGRPAARAVLEVRSRDVPFLIEDGQPVGRLVFEQLADAADELYGAARGLELSAPGAEAVEAFPGLAGIADVELPPKPTPLCPVTGKPAVRRAQWVTASSCFGRRIASAGWRRRDWCGWTGSAW